MGTVEGIITRTSKKGYVGTTLFIGGQPMNDYDRSADIRCEGYRVESVYIGKALNVKVGDKVNLIWGKGWDDKAVVVDIQIVK